MNKIDILLDIVEFEAPLYENEKAKITLKLLNSGHKKFFLSLKQYQNLKDKINKYRDNVFCCYGDFSYIWSDADQFNFLESSFNATKLFTYNQFCEKHSVLLSCNNGIRTQNINNSYSYNSNNYNKDYDISIMASNELLKEELEKYNAHHLINYNYIGQNNIDDVKLVLKNKSYEYQEQTSKLAIVNNQFGMFMEPGLGKTKTALDAMATLFKNKQIKKCLVFPPANLVNNWKEEINKHCHKLYIPKIEVYSNKDLEKLVKNKKKIEEIEIQLKTETVKKKIKELKSELLLIKPIPEQYLEEIKSGEVLIILDEFHNFKNPLAQKTQYLLSILSELSKIFVLTATPYPKGFEDMFVTFKIFNIINKNINWFQFKNFFFDEIKNGFGGVEKKVLKKDKVYLSKLIHSRLKAKSVWFMKKDVLDLPEQNYITHYYEASPEQNAIIQNILNETPIPDHINPNSMPFSNKELRDSLIKIMQIQGGFYLDKEGNFCELEVNNKFKLLLEILEEHKGEKIIIFCAFTAEADLINKKINNLGYRSVCKHGKLKKKIGEAAISQFKSADFDILVATGDSAGTGFTLIDGCTIIYYSNNFNSVTREQAEGRIHRVGQTRDCTYHDLLSIGGVDEIVYNCIKRKQISKNQMFAKLKSLQIKKDS